MIPKAKVIESIGIDKGVKKMSTICSKTKKIES